MSSQACPRPRPSQTRLPRAPLGRIGNEMLERIGHSLASPLDAYAEPQAAIWSKL